jgi:uncharacterized protein (DUF952 family)
MLQEQGGRIGGKQRAESFLRRSAWPGSRSGIEEEREGMRAGIYKICGREEWAAAEQAGVYTGSADDLRDGFIHLSSAAQVAGTAERYFAGRKDLVLVAVDAARLSGSLRWEPSRGGQLFPHLYGPLPLSAVPHVATLPLGADGRHVLPEGIA